MQCKRLPLHEDLDLRNELGIDFHFNIHRKYTIMMMAPYAQEFNPCPEKLKASLKLALNPETILEVTYVIKMVRILSWNLSCSSIFNDQSVYLLVTQERLPLLQIEIIGFNAEVMNSR